MKISGRAWIDTIGWLKSYSDDKQGNLEGQRQAGSHTGALGPAGKLQASSEPALEVMYMVTSELTLEIMHMVTSSVTVDF